MTRRRRRRRSWRRIKKSPKGKQKDKRLKTPERRVVVDPSRDAKENFFLDSKMINRSRILIYRQLGEQTKTDLQTDRWYHHDSGEQHVTRDTRIRRVYRERTL